MCYQVFVGLCLLHCSEPDKCLNIVPLASLNSVLPDDGDHTETC